MKKGMTFLLALILPLFLALPVLGAEFQLGYVTDAAGLLTEEERAGLEEKAQDISHTYQCGVYLITMEDFTDYSRERSIYEAAKEIYRQYSLGWGEEKSGVLLMLSMAERDYALIAYGYGNTAFTDYGKDRLTDVFLDDFAENSWYSGFTDYLKKSESMLSSARSGSPLDIDSDPAISTAGTVISIVLGCLLSLAVCLILRGQMSSAREKSEANAYISGRSIHFSRREDQFTHVTEHRVKIEKNKGGSSGGGTSIGRSGFSGKSGKF